MQESPLSYHAVMPLLAGLLGLALSTASSASEGVMEINQVCALTTGCFVGDAPGFPVTIDAGPDASYRLTGDLLVPDESTNAIEVLADNVSIDLGGFEIRGVTTCSGVPLICSPTGTGRGVSAMANGIQIRNGSIIGMGSTGISVQSNSSVEDVRSTQNGFFGIVGVLPAAIIRNNIANMNGNIGIFVADGAAITGNSASNNGNIGIAAGSGSTILENATHSNGVGGIGAGPGSTVAGNTSNLNGLGMSIQEGSLARENVTYQNVGTGISGTDGVTILDNSVVNNGGLSSGDGISCGSGCFIHGNTVRDNLDQGISLGTDSAYRENVVTNNVVGGVVGLGAANDRGGNYCAGVGVTDPLCP